MNKITRVIIIIVVGLTLVLGFFVFNFRDQQLSPNILDWGAFGSYIGGTVGVISVYLVYRTYNNQVRANRRSQFESILYQMVDNLSKMYRENSDGWRKVVAGIDEYFICADFVESSLLTKSNTYDAIEKCYGYYSSDAGIERYMDVFANIIDYIDQEDSVDQSIKSEYYAFVSSQMSNEVLMVLMIQIIVLQNDKTINLLDKAGFFRGVQLNNKVLEKIRQLFFPNTSPKHLTGRESEEGFVLDLEEGIGCFNDYYSEHIARKE